MQQLIDDKLIEIILIFVVSFGIAAIVAPVAIPVLTRIKFGQVVRDDGPSSHLKKTGTPTIGGIIFLVPLIIICAYFIPKMPSLIPLVLVTTGFGLVGLLDDLIKVVKKRKDGLFYKQKLFLLLLIASAFSVYTVWFSNTGTLILVPFLGNGPMVDLGFLFIPFTICVLVSSTNAVNITDGLDGLAAGVTIPVLLLFTLFSVLSPGFEGVRVFTVVLTGALLGFLLFNIHPAKVFMGDTGSLALGGAVGACAVTLKMPLIFLIAGLIYVVEAVSVIIQVTSFRTRGKRVFKMAPLHHHFELSGWKETKVVYAFWLVAFICCILAFISVEVI